MTATHLTDPGAVLIRLEEIERDLALRQGAYEAAALAWFRAKREKERDRAIAFLRAEVTVAERSAQADRDTTFIGAAEDAEFEAIRAVVSTLETRASIGQSILRSQGRA